ncbi:hypothetical protein C2845_PM03G24650 [Panicum miliaceum]|uniref:Uncharacterized protein n=1 Tax=Panicum miliaceum TaxID=4540 RepID=A0A3L6T5S2_PANMI|nr:hypothetical protein C2845_PM03G24650 [Panicum miliaceum]
MGCWDDWKPCIICLAIAAAVSGAGVALAAYGFISHVRIAVEDASLTRFDLVEASPAAAALAYNLSLMLTVRNRNWAMAITNRNKLEAAYAFDGQPFDRALLAEKGKKHGPRRTRLYHLGARSNGTAVPTLGSAGRRRRVQEAERDGVLRGGGEGHRQVQVHSAPHQVRPGGDVPAEAAARATGDAGHRVPEGQVQARQAQEVLLIYLMVICFD